MIKTLCIVGTRPEAIKMAPIIKQLDKNSLFSSKVCTTRQHTDMLDSVFDLFQITPDFELDVMEKQQSLSTLTAKIINQLTSVFEHFLPDVVLVHGDTTTTLAASLASYYHKIPVVHIEAGLRTGDIYAPWPEEMNRKLTSSIACLHFAPTQQAKENLLKEGVLESYIYVTGNTVVDALFFIKAQITHHHSIETQLRHQFPFVSDKKYILVTCHRRENFGHGLQQICLALQDIATHHPDFNIIYLMHLNPQVKEPITKNLTDISNIYLIDPVNYLAFVYLMQNAYIILTDSGGIQEEAPSLGKPVLVMRDKTERPEALASKVVKLIGTNRNTIKNAVTELITDSDAYNSMCKQTNPYGDGFATERIIFHITNYFQKNKEVEPAIHFSTALEFDV